MWRIWWVARWPRDASNEKAAHRAAFSLEHGGSLSGQLAQRFVDASALRFQFADEMIAIVRGRLRRADIVDRHLEATELDHQVVAQKQRIDTHGSGVAHGSDSWIPVIQQRASAVPARQIACLRKNAPVEQSHRRRHRGDSDDPRPNLTARSRQLHYLPAFRDDRHSLPFTVAATFLP